MKFKVVLILAIGFLINTNIQAQRYNLGIRAGLNYSKFIGPSEEGMLEGKSLNNGIHFGMTFAYKLNDIAGFKTEIAYTAIGSKDSIVGDSYYIFGIGNENVAKTGYAKRYLDISNSYINVPFHAYIFPFKKLELFGGPYIAFLINPTAAGRIEFNDQSDELKYSFIQSLDYNYFTDKATRGKGFGEVVTVIVDDTRIVMPQVAGAYYQFITKNGGLYNIFDLGISGGLQYYINKSFFAGFRANYGLLDVTRQKMDVSYRSLDNGTYILRDDRDTNFSMQFSLGFKF